MPQQLIPPTEPPVRLTASPEPDDGAHGPSSLEMINSRAAIHHNNNNSDEDDEGEPSAYHYALMGNNELEDSELELSNAFRRNDDLHPIVQGLSIADVEACTALEMAAFPPEERCSREKFQYRLTACPEFAVGVFSTTTRKAAVESKATFDAARAPDSSQPDHKFVLLGHVSATLTTADVVTDASMSFPESFSSTLSQDSNKTSTTTTESIKAPPPSQAGLPDINQSGDAPGHHPAGKTIAIHSVAVLPQFQGSGLGKMILRSYLQRMEGSGVADKAVLLAHSNMVPFYVDNFGFVDLGPSKVSFGGGGWNDMVYDFNDLAHWG